MDIVDFINSNKAVWTFWIFGLVGLFTTLYWTTVEEKRGPKLKDLYKFIGWLPFVLAVSAQVDVSPWFSLVIGIAPERVYKLFKNRGLNLTFGPNNEIMLGFSKAKSEPVTPKPDKTETKS